MLPLARRRRPAPHAVGVLALVLTTALWGTSFVATRIAVAEMPPATLVLLRCACAYLALRPLAARGGRGEQPLDATAFVLGATGVVVPVVLHNLALRWSGAADATLFHSGSYPVLTGLLAQAVLGERLGRRLGVGLIASLVGVAVVGFGGGHLLDDATGSVLLVAGTGVYAIYTVAGRRAFAAGAWLGRLVTMIRAAMLLLLPLAAGELILGGLPRPSLAAVLATVYLGVGCSGLAHWANALALRRLDASRVAVIGNLEIPLGIAAGALLLGEPIGPEHLGGATLILAGAWLASRPAPPAREPGAHRPSDPWSRRNAPSRCRDNGRSTAGRIIPRSDRSSPPSEARWPPSTGAATQPIRRLLRIGGRKILT